MKSTRFAFCRAFSLVELLVVMGIIVLLVGMFLPALAKAQRQARSTTCKSNLRQCGILLLTYANDNNGWMFPTGWGTNVPRAKRWPVYVFKPPVWNPRVMLCPEDDNPAEEHSYLLNRHMADKGIKLGNRSEMSVTDIVVMGEKITTEPDYYLEAISDETEFTRVVELYRHGTELGSNYLFLDLHVAPIAPRQARQAIDPWDVLKTDAPK